MKLVFLQSNCEKLKVVQNVIPLALIPFVGKPLLQRQLELAAEEGVTDCTLICYHGVDRIRHFCGDGRRFGLKVRLASSRAADSKIENLLKHRHLFKEPFILALGSHFARMPLKAYYQDHVEAGRSLTIIESAQTQMPYACIVSPEALSLFEKGGFELVPFLDSIRETDIPNIKRIVFHGHAATCQKLDDILKLNRSTLEDPDFRPYDKLTEAKTGIFLGHHVRIHPAAELIPPVAIGDFCTVSKDAVIGPNVTVGSESFIGRGVNLENAIVCESSYVGDMVSVKKNLIAGSNMVNLKSGTKVSITDSFLIDNLDAFKLDHYVSMLIHKGVAAGLLVLLAQPGVAMALLSKIRKDFGVKGALCFGSAEISEEDNIESLPQFERLMLCDSSLPFGWYPSLLNVLKGQMRLVGPDAITVEDEERLNNKHKKRFWVAPGLVGLSALFDGDEEAAQIAEVLYAHNNSVKMDIRILSARLVMRFGGKKWATKIAGL